MGRYLLELAEANSLGSNNGRGPKGPLNRCTERATYPRALGSDQPDLYADGPGCSSRPGFLGLLSLGIVPPDKHAVQYLLRVV